MRSGQRSKAIKPRLLMPSHSPPPVGTMTAPPSCFSCGHCDGRGSAWPGVCRYFETIGQAAKEIDFNAVDVDRGCKCYEARRLTPEIIASNDRQKLRADDPGRTWMPGNPFTCECATKEAREGLSVSNARDYQRGRADDIAER